jgi:hypothetical protein
VKRWWQDCWPVIVMVVLLAALILAMIIFAVRDEQNWDRFKVDHNCKVVGKQAPQVIAGINSDGKVGVGTTSGSTTWLCDDGVEYTR